MIFTKHEADALAAMFDGTEDDQEIEVLEGDENSHSGSGLYACDPEYHDEGSVFLSEE